MEERYIMNCIDVREYASYDMHIGHFERKSIEKVAVSDLKRVEKIERAKYEIQKRLLRSTTYIHARARVCVSCVCMFECKYTLKL